MYSALPGALSLSTELATQLAQELAHARAAQVDHRHVRDVEHAGVVADQVVFVDLRAVVDRHVPAAEVDHLGAERAMGVVEDGLLRHGGVPWGARAGHYRTAGIAELRLRVVGPRWRTRRPSPASRPVASVARSQAPSRGACHRTSRSVAAKPTTATIAGSGSSSGGLRRRQVLRGSVLVRCVSPRVRNCASITRHRELRSLSKLRIVRHRA